MRVTISRRDTADTAITAELLDSSLHVHSFSLSPGSGRTEDATRKMDKSSNSLHIPNVNNTI